LFRLAPKEGEKRGKTRRLLTTPRAKSGRKEEQIEKAYDPEERKKRKQLFHTPRPKEEGKKKQEYPRTYHPTTPVGKKAK